MTVSFTEFVTIVPDEKKQLYIGFRECKMISDLFVKIKSFESENVTLQCGSSGSRVIVHVFALDNRILILLDIIYQK